MSQIETTATMHGQTDTFFEQTLMTAGLSPSFGLTGLPVTCYCSVGACYA